MPKSTCTFDGCGRNVHGRGLCASHYKQWQLGKPITALGPRNGSVDPKILFWAKVEKTDTCWVWKGSLQRGYGCFRYQGEPRRAHRVSYEWANGPIPAGMEIDHICHTRACIRPDHLRAVTRKQNVENFTGPQRSNTSGVHGVWWHKPSRKWLASVTHNKVRHRLGSFSDLEDAERAVVAKRLELHTHNELDKRAAA